MTTEQFLKTFEYRIDNAIYESAQVALFDVRKYVPIDTGKLRNSGRIEKHRGYSEIIFGNQDTPYTRYQYYTAKRHVVRRGVLARMLSIIPTGVKSTIRGQTNKQRYGRAYRYAKNNDLLAKFPRGVQWFRFINENEALRKRMLNRFIKEFRRGER